MSLKFLTALACAASAFALSAADAAVFTYSYSYTGVIGTVYSGSGKLFADDNNDGTFTVTGANGTVHDDNNGDDTIVGAVSLSDYVSGPTLFSLGDPTAYSFDTLRLEGLINVYDFRTISFPPEGDDPASSFIIGTAWEDGGEATFSITRDDAPTQTSDVPEPASWAMMVGGFGLLGAALRRKRVSVSFG